MQRLALFFLIASALPAADQTGTVRAADQFIPGAKITASLGDKKVTAYTDEDGHYKLKLDPGVWDVSVEMLGFTTVHEQITVGDQPSSKDWAIEMPKYAGAKADSGIVPDPAAAGARRGRGGQGRGRGPGRGQPGVATANGRGAPAPGTAAPATPAAPSPGQRTFQNAQVTATPEGQTALAQAAQAPPPELAGVEDPDEGLLSIIGSTSGGLDASSDAEAQRQRAIGRGGPGGPGGPGGGAGFDSATAALGLPPGMAVTSDSLGLGGLGASAVNAGFGTGIGGGPGGAGDAAPGLGFGGPGGSGGGGGGFGGGGGGGRGGGGGGRGGGRGGARGPGRGPFNGQFNSFGNRRRAQPLYTGSVFIQLNNSALNAAPFSLNGLAAEKPSYDQARFGFNIGGPIIIPKVANWSKTSFFLNYTGNVSRNPFSQLSTVPTALQRSGDFSQTTVNGQPLIIYDPTTGMPFQGNMIPSTRISPIATALLNYFPLPTYSGITENYRIVNATPNNNNNVSVRVVIPISTKDRINFNEQFQVRNSESEQLFGFHDASTGTGFSSAAGWNHSFAPRVNNAATVTLSRNTSQSTPYFATQGVNVAQELGINGTSQIPANYGPPSLSFTNFGSLSDGTESLTRSQTVNFTDNFTWVYKRKHNFTFGYLYRRLQQNVLTDSNGRGSFSFSGLLTSELNANGQPIAGTGYDFADFLLGLPQSSSLRFGSDNNYFRSWATSAYANDDFRVSRGVTINFGVRYEYFAPYTELYGHLANLDLNSTFTNAQIVTAGEPGPYSGALPSSLVRPEKLNFSPRFGFAWRVSQKANVVLRGGYSIFYTSSPYAQIATQLASQPPFAHTASISTSTAVPLTIANGFPTILSEVITNTYAINPNFKLPYAQTWNFTVQNTFPHQLLVEVETIGTKGTQLGVVEQPNRSLTESVLNAQQTLQIADATGFNYQTYGADSIFLAGQTRVTRRFATGMSGVLLYTYSKSIDNASSFNAVGGTTVQFINNWGLERGLSTFDQRQQLQGTYLLSSPVGVHGMMRNGGWKTAALAGWTMQGNIVLATGTPLTARVLGNLANTGGVGGGTRAEATGLPIQGTDGEYFNPLAFTVPAAGTFGDAGRDTITGPDTFAINASLNRAWRIGESRRQFQLRLSATNALNHVVVTGFGTTVNSATYGLPTSASATRVVTLLLRFNF